MTNQRSNMHPEWFSPPGATIHALMNIKQVPFLQLSEHLELEKSDTRNLIDGNFRIDAKIALKLEKYLGGSAEFWLKRQSDFEDDLARCKADVSDVESRKFLAEFPLGEMKKNGWLPNNCDSLSALLQFFDVQGVDHWRCRYENKARAVAFRQSAAFEISTTSTLVWLRQAERVALATECAPWNKKLFSSSLAEMRALSRKKRPSAFLPKLATLCAASGVALVCLPPPPGCRASGATQFLSKDKAVIVMSFRHRSDDHFWFTFFHEAGHLILHDKNALFVEQDGDVTEEEEQADQFSRNVLLSADHWARLSELRLSSENIIRFAVQCDLAPGIVVGQLQHAGLLKYNQLNSLKRRYSKESLAEIFYRKGMNF
tara:strand:+ start:469 stop:1584 length:1116 start_codon:yes stop_codon:yes gene_type:complete